MASKFRAGDIILTDSSGIFSALILFVTRRFAEWRGKRVPYSHAALVVDGDCCAEALAKVVLTPLSKRLSEKSSKRYLVLRLTFLTAKERAEIARLALRQVGRPYSFWRLFLCWLDGATDTRVFGDADKNSHRLVCSSLVAYCFKNYWWFNDSNWEDCTPEDIYADYLAHPGSYRVAAEKK